MPEINEQAILNQAIQDLEPQVPIRSWSRDGDVLTLYLASGDAIEYNWKEGRATESAVPEGDLSQLLKSELLDIAADVELDGRSKMTKAELSRTNKEG